MTPYAGSYFYFSGSGNNLDNRMTRSVTLPAGAVSLTAKVRYDIELDWDYAYLTVNGAPVPTNLSTNTNPNGQNFGQGITGSTGGNWVNLTANLSAYAGQTVTLGFRYWTDGAVAMPGLSLDEIAITGSPIDGAETDPGWAYAGFLRTNGTVTLSYFNAYFGEYRQYRGYDDSLRTGPYNFGFLNNPTLQNWVEHFPYQDGLLVWYYDTSFPDNNVGDNCDAGRCGGLVLPVDAHPDLLIRPDNGTGLAAENSGLRFHLRAVADRSWCASTPTAWSSAPETSRRIRCSTTRRATGSHRIQPSATSAGQACRCRRPARPFASTAFQRTANSCRSPSRRNSRLLRLWARFPPEPRPPLHTPAHLSRS